MRSAAVLVMLVAGACAELPAQQTCNDIASWSGSASAANVPIHAGHFTF